MTIEAGPNFTGTANDDTSVTTADPNIIIKHLLEVALIKVAYSTPAVGSIDRKILSAGYKYLSPVPA